MPCLKQLYSQTRGTNNKYIYVFKKNLIHQLLPPANKFYFTWLQTKPDSIRTCSIFQNLYYMDYLFTEDTYTIILFLLLLLFQLCVAISCTNYRHVSTSSNSTMFLNNQFHLSNDMQNYYIDILKIKNTQVYTISVILTFKPTTCEQPCGVMFKNVGRCKRYRLIKKNLIAVLKQ